MCTTHALQRLPTGLGVNGQAVLPHRIASPLRPSLCTKKALRVPVTAPLPQMPAIPTQALDLLKELIEWMEEEHIPTLAGFIADIQVQHSRLESTLSTAKSGVGPLITTFNLEEYAVDCALIHARASSFFDYGRRRSQAIPHQITWEAVSRALSFFGLDDLPKREKRGCLGAFPFAPGQKLAGEELAGPDVPDRAPMNSCSCRRIRPQ